MKQVLIRIFPVILIIICAGVFFRQTLVSGKLPVPADSLVGMYHPWKDAKAAEYPNGIPFKNFLITDPIRQQIPWRKLAMDHLKRGEPGGWNPYNFAGSALSTNIQSGLYYPLNILFFILPFPVAWTALILLQSVLAGLFMYVFLRRSLQLERLAGLFGSVMFMFCGFMIAWLTWGTIGHTILWLPLILHLADLLLGAGTRKRMSGYALLLGFLVAVQYMAGHSQIALYSIVLVIGYTSFRLWEAKSSRVPFRALWVRFALASGVALTLTSVHWFPFIGSLATLSRIQQAGSMQEDGFFFPLVHFIQLVVPDFFGNPATLNYWGVWNYGEFVGYAGVAGILFALYAVLTKQWKRTAFWTGAILVSLIGATDNPVSRIPYILHIPVLSSLQPTRLIAIIDVGLCVLGAIGLDSWIKKRDSHVVFGSLGILGVVFVGVWLVILLNPLGIPVDSLAVARRNSLLPSLMYAAFSGVILVSLVPRQKKTNLLFTAVLASGIVILTAGDLMRFGWKFTPFTDPALFFPRTQTIDFLTGLPKPYRIAVLDDRILPPNTNAYYGIESVSGYDPLYGSRYETFIASVERGNANIEPPYGFKRIITPKNFRSPLFPHLSARYLLSLDGLVDPNLKEVFREGATIVYEYQAALPRVYLPLRVSVEADGKAIIRRMNENTFVAGEDAILEERADIPVRIAADANESVAFKSYSDNRMVLDVRLSRMGLVLINTPFDQGWRATSGGKQIRVYRANYLFMGVVLDAGEHILELIYD